MSAAELRDAVADADGWHLRTPELARRRAGELIGYVQAGPGWFAWFVDSNARQAVNDTTVTAREAIADADAAIATLRRHASDLRDAR